MITLPALPAPNAVDPSMIDFGVDLPAALGGDTIRVNRPGNRFRAQVSFPLMPPEIARVFISRLLRAKSVGLRLEFPLLGVNQGGLAIAAVNGGGQAGTVIALRGLAPGQTLSEGFWISIVGGGRHHLHNLTNAVTATGAGFASVGIVPALRFPFPDGAPVHLAQPMLEGFVLGEAVDWAVRVDRLTALAFAIEERG